jgi:hypothetical protein
MNRDGANFSGRASSWCAANSPIECAVSGVDCAEWGLLIVFDQLAQPVLIPVSSRSGQH